MSNPTNFSASHELLELADISGAEAVLRELLAYSGEARNTDFLEHIRRMWDLFEDENED